MACFIRIFRVLHTVQSSVFKVHLLSICVSSNFYILSQSQVFVNNFFYFLFSYSLAPLVLTAAQEISYQMLRQMSTGFYIFLTLLPLLFLLVQF